MLSGIPRRNSHDEVQDWVSDDYDPDAFSIEDVNQMLTPLRRRRDKTSRGWLQHGKQIPMSYALSGCLVFRKFSNDSWIPRKSQRS
jgi:hypothetical protein